jgi:hypothetical protein
MRLFSAALNLIDRVPHAGISKTVFVTNELGKQWVEEAVRLRVLPGDVQREVIGIHLASANDPKPTRADRKTA